MFFVLEILDKVDGKKTFTDTALAVKNQDETFFNHIVHRVLRVQLS